MAGRREKLPLGVEPGIEADATLLPVLSPASSESSSKGREGRGLALALLLLWTALVLAPVLFADFIRLDDYSHLFDNPNMRSMSFAGLAASWTKPYFNLYIPVTYSVWWAVATVATAFGALRQQAWAFHALNLAVHLANVSLVFFVVRGLLRAGSDESSTRGRPERPTVPLLAALFFATHPVQVETVAWISELKGELAAMFGLLGLWWHYRSPRPVLSAVFFVAATLSKPSAVVFPGIVLLVDRILLGTSLRKSAPLPLLYGLLLLPVVLVTKHLQPDANLDFIPTLPQRLAVAADALAFYSREVLVPAPLAVDYGRSPQYVLAHVAGWRTALTALFLAAGVAVAVEALVRPRPSWANGRWYPVVSCGWAIFLLSIAPVLGFIPFDFQEVSTVADHYLYVPLFGASLIAAGILIRFDASAASRHAAAAVLAILAVLSFRQATLWRSTESLFAHTVSVNPRSYLGCYCIADEHMHAGRLDPAFEWASRSLAINPNYLNAQILLGLVWLQKGDYEKAIDQYDSALAKNPSTAGTRARHVSSIHNNLGMVLLRVGREAEAVDHFRKAVEIFPRSVNAHLNLGNVAFDGKRYSEAIAEYEIAEALSPGNPAVAQRLGRARQRAHAGAPNGDGQ